LLFKLIVRGEIMLKVASVFIVGFILMTANALASGPYLGDADGNKIDFAYEHGKALYSGRIPSVGKIKFCVPKGNKFVKVERKTLKPYVGGDFGNLGNSLVNCDQPDERIVDRIGESNTGFVLHYLDKRYKLKLKRS